MESCEPPAALNVLFWPVVAQKNRVGGSPAFSFVFAFQYIGETLDTPAENGGCGYDFASGVHKYLYAADDPVNNSDPSGNDYGDFNINILSIFNLLIQSVLPIGLPSQLTPLQYYMPPAETMTVDRDPNPPGSQTYTAKNGEQFIGPSGIDFKVEYNAGATDGLMGIQQITFYGRFDYQRNKGQGEKQDNILYTAYENAGNYGVGVYMKGAKQSLSDTIADGDRFAGKKRSQGTKDRQHHWWTLGWNDANAGYFPTGK
jgi:hypothetical protein